MAANETYQVISSTPIVIENGGLAISYSPGQTFSASPKLPSVTSLLLRGAIIQVLSGGPVSTEGLILDSQLAERYILANGTRSFTGAQSLNGHALTNVLDPVNPQDAATKFYVDSVAGGGPATQLATPGSPVTINTTSPSVGQALVATSSTNATWQTLDFLKSDGSVQLTANWDVGSFQLNNVVDPTLAQDAATKNYVDSALSGYIKEDGTVPLTANWSVGGFSLSEVAGILSTTDQNVQISAQGSGSVLFEALSGGKIELNCGANPVQFDSDADLTGNNLLNVNTITAGSGDTAFNRSSAGNWVVTPNGPANHVQIGIGGLVAAANNRIGFSSTNSDATQAVDAAFCRTGSSAVSLGDGNLGNTSGSLTLRTVVISGSTSGTISIQAPAVAGAQTYTLPTATGTNGYFLQTNGAGVLTWAAAGGGGGGRLGVQARNADYSLTAANEGNVQTNEGASGEVTLTLPPLVLGARFFVAVIDAQYLRVANYDNSTTISLGAVATTAAGGYVRSNAPISMLEIVAVSSTKWAARVTGNWTADA